jgi:Domain of unknown function (DUF4276)
MSYDLIFLLEEPSIKNVLEHLLPQILPIDTSYTCIAHQGKQDLAKSIPKKLKAFKKSNPTVKFVIVHDQDSNDCKQLKAELLKICQDTGNSEVLIRIICHELESWFLGDLAAVEMAYNLKFQSIRKKQNQKKFRNPDQLNSAKQELKKLVDEYYAGTHSKKIAPHLSLTENTSCSFHIFLDGVQKLIAQMPSP